MQLSTALVQSLLSQVSLHLIACVEQVVPLQVHFGHTMYCLSMVVHVSSHIHDCHYAVNDSSHGGFTL